MSGDSGFPDLVPEEDLDVQPYPEHFDPGEFDHISWEDQEPMGTVLPFPAAAPAPGAGIAGGQGGTQAGIYRALDDVQLEDLPDPEWLVEPYLQRGAFVLLYSDAGVGKSFVALEWSLGLATGVLGLGKLSQRGAVAYIAAEGVSGYKKRVRAWKKDREVPGRAGVFFYRGAYDLRNPVVLRDLVQALLGLPERPKLVVVDTLARCAPGADENSAQDMGVFVSSVDRIREAIGCAVLVLHHSGRSGSHERGSTALRAAADIAFSIERRGAQLQLVCQKQKDFDEGQPQPFVLRVVPLEAGETSCVVDTGGRVGPKVTPVQLKLLAALVEQFPAEQPTMTEFIAASGVSKATVYRHIEALEAAGFVVLDRSLTPLVRLGVTDLGFRTTGISPEVVVDVSAEVVKDE